MGDGQRVLAALVLPAQHLLLEENSFPFSESLMFPVYQPLSPCSILLWSQVAGNEGQHMIK